jgi:hypothetical protein
MKKLIEKIKSIFSRKPLLVIPAVSGSTPHPEEILTPEQIDKADALGVPGESTILMTGDELNQVYNGELEGSNIQTNTPKGYKPKTINQIGRLAPIAYNLWQGLTPEDRLRAGDYTIDQKLDPATLNIDPILRRNQEGFSAMQNNIASASAGSGGTYLSNIAQAQLNKQKGDSDAYINKSNYDEQQRVDADKFNIGLDQYNRQTTQNIDDWNMRSKANRMSHFSDAAYNIAGLSEASEQTRADAFGYSKMAPQFSYLDYFNRNKKK